MRHTLRLQYQSHNVTVSNKSLKICALCPPGRCTKKKKKSGRSYMKSACMYERSYTLKKRCAHYDCWQILYFFLLSIFLMDKMIKVNLVGTMVKLHHKSKRSTVAHHDFWYHTKKKKNSPPVTFHLTTQSCFKNWHDTQMENSLVQVVHSAGILHSLPLWLQQSALIRLNI